MALKYTSYFDRIPKLQYDINRSLINAKYETVTNVFFRVRVIQEVLNNINAYIVVELEDGDTPEIIAEKVYGDPGAAWMILIANQIIDPQWQWPLTEKDFQNYIISKYGSIENAQITPHHYEMVVERDLRPDNITTERRYEINEKRLAGNDLDVPYNFYFNYFYPQVFLDKVLSDNTNITVDSTQFTVDSGYESREIGQSGLQEGSLAFTQYLSTYEIEGKTVYENIYGNMVTNYDYEDALNDKRRVIKIIKKEYYNQINDEFTKLTGTESPFRRQVR